MEIRNENMVNVYKINTEIQFIMTVSRFACYSIYTFITSVYSCTSIGEAVITLYDRSSYLNFLFNKTIFLQTKNEEKQKKVSAMV